MERTQRSSYDAAFKLKAIDLAALEGTGDAARKLGVNESIVQRWRRQWEKLILPAFAVLHQEQAFVS